VTSVLYIAEPEETSRVAFLATLLYLGGLELFNSSQGIGFLAEALADRVDVRLGVGVREVRADVHPATDGGSRPLSAAPGGPALLTLDDGSQIEADAVIVTVPASQVGPLVPDLPGAVLDAFREVPYGASTPVALGLSRPMSETAFVINLSRLECRTVAAVAFEHNKHPARVPEGHCLLMAYPGAEAGARLLQVSDERVIQAVLHDVEKLYPRISSQVDFARVYRWPYAAAGLRPGDLARRAELRAALPTSGPLFFAGDYLFSSSSIEGSVVSGLKAAERAGSFLRLRAS
jgi:protoporphyrinogen/coproporphyrinogen III oxidase